ncbi:hypothetical protein D3C87_2036310 [compost metagenome]
MGRNDLVMVLAVVVDFVFISVGIKSPVIGIEQVLGIFFTQVIPVDVSQNALAIAAQLSLRHAVPRLVSTFFTREYIDPYKTLLAKIPA